MATGIVLGMSNHLEIFRPGTHKAMSGQTLDFSEAVVREIVDGYDTALHEAPIVVGHPKIDDPAYGWVKGLEFSDGILKAEPQQVEAQFAEMVEAGRFKKISASFFSPTHGNNPTPGKYYLKHVGFLGAVPPAVKGLKSAEFADDEDTITVEFGEGSMRDGQIARLLRGVRDLFIEKFGKEAADRAVPNYAIDMIGESAAVEAAADNPHSFSEANDPAQRAGEEAEPEASNQEASDMDPKKEEELKAREAEIKRREDEQAAKDAAFAESQAKASHEANAEFVDGLVKDAKLAPGVRDDVVGFMDSLVGAEEVSFSDDAGTTSPLEFFKSLLDGGSAVIDLSERSGADDGESFTADFAVDDGDEVDQSQMKLHRQVAALSRKEGIPYEEALQRVAS